MSECGPDAHIFEFDGHKLCMYDLMFSKTPAADIDKWAEPLLAKGHTAYEIAAALKPVYEKWRKLVSAK